MDTGRPDKENRMMKMRGTIKGEIRWQPGLESGTS